ncbi:hypothetical protein WR25_00834 [Diploscapter pachys]|uniref:Serpin domain-containing protein n=1 Tax=Diploscapter pachys TaxID=2018661 RepID=A0A2A2JV33_9BILA|nr:hypothetical protein WR25_00834 [Diploscapter pachys]
MYLETESSFGVNLLQQFPINGSSFVFSPLLIALALSLVHAGSKGSTKKQIANAICKGANDGQLIQHYSDLSDSFAKPVNGVEVNLANKAFANKKFPLKPTYLTTIKSSYNASAENLDFKSAGQAAKTTNDFVKGQTRGKIPEIIK